MPKKKDRPTTAEEEISIDDIPFDSIIEVKGIVVSDLASFVDAQEMLKEELTPIEKVMAIELLAMDREFYMQYKVDYEEGTQIHGKKSAIPDFLIIPRLSQEASFYFKEEFPLKGLVIECDGKTHLDSSEYDRARDAMLMSLGYQVIRFTGDDIFNNFKKWVRPCIREAADRLDSVADRCNNSYLAEERAEEEWKKEKEEMESHGK